MELIEKYFLVVGLGMDRIDGIWSAWGEFEGGVFWWRVETKGLKAFIVFYVAFCGSS